MATVPKQDFSKSLEYKITGYIIIVIGLIAGSQITSNGYLGALFAAPFAYIGSLFLRQAKKYSVERGEAVLTKDQRPPVLYLRSFLDEEQSAGILKDIKNSIYYSKDSSDSERRLAPRVNTSMIEEQGALAHAFRKTDPYIALGKPDEENPQLGSSKLYTENENWQGTICSYFKNARLIVFNCGKTEGLKWELTQLIQTVNPLKVLIIVPLRDEDYFGFTMWANSIMPVSFPDKYPPFRLIIFDSKWQYRFLKQGKTLMMTLAPFFEQNEIMVKESYWEKIFEHNLPRW